MSVGAGKSFQHLWRSDAEPLPFAQTPLAALTADLRPVRPLAAAWRRALYLALGAASVGALFVALTALRADIDETSALVTWWPAATELGLGALALLLSMRGAVPGGGIRTTRAWLLGSGALLVAIAAAAIAPQALAEHVAGPGADPHAGIPCALWLMAAALPALVGGLWMIARAAALSGVLSGALAGLGAGLLADAALHLHCPVIDPAHTLVWHVGPVALLSALGALIARRVARW